VTDEDAIRLGPCCVCRREGPTVRNILMLPHRTALPEHGGHGCFVCGMPLVGAVAVVCDSCMEPTETIYARLVDACRGYPGEDGREPIDQTRARGPFEHDMRYHEAQERRRVAPLN
jgi:hypothetical protein